MPRRCNPIWASRTPLGFARQRARRGRAQDLLGTGRRAPLRFPCAAPAAQALSGSFETTRVCRDVLQPPADQVTRFGRAAVRRRSHTARRQSLKQSRTAPSVSLVDAARRKLASAAEATITRHGL